MKRFRNGQGTTFRSGSIIMNSINMNTIVDNQNQNTELLDGIGDGNNSNSNFSMNNSNGGSVASGALIKRRYEMFQMSNSQDSSNTFPIPLQSPSEEYSNSVFTALDNDLLGDKLMQPPEEPNYFAEKYPGKVCALCNLGERSQLGQGELLRIELRDNEKIKTPLSSPVEGKDPLFSDKSPRSASALQLHNRRQKGLNKCKNPVMTAEYVNELDKIGYVESLEFSVLHDGGYFYVHRSCAMWSVDIVRESNGALDNIGNVVTTSLSRKCTYCQRFGASITCKMSCPKFFHYPCVAASGAFQIIHTYATFCKDHLGQVPLVCSDDINCRTCAGLGDVSNLMTCCICGDHYHGSCIGVAQQPGIRAGWQCTNCRSCQICRVPDSTEGRTVGCEQCDKIYHATCLRPIMATIPKFGWKCRCCRVCSDCGSRSPGAGTSSRWHAHYTVCDSCYQQRNKGFQCPICHRAYRAAGLREMVKCSTCNKFVHGNCDPDAEPNIYHAKKDTNPEYEYVCAPCKSIAQNGRITAAMRRNSAVEEDNMSVSQESLYDDNTMDVDLTEKILPDVGLGKGKPYAASKVAKKRLGISSNQTGRPKGIGKLAFQKRFKFSDFGRKRNTKSKMRGIFGVPGVGLQKPSSQATDNNTKPEEEPGIENRLVLCSAKDKFVLTQDICVMCGAIGTDQEGCLISCVQCGQCYHPYCVMVKVTKVILQKGWRCLDCTVCEGCGQRNDEARLILCDDCDISYHIYCMDPPLDYVPHGNWKCKWCAICLKCGANDPGKNSVWMSSYTECGPCSSQSSCPVCTEGYSEGELIIQCTSCDRWLHCGCDAIRNEDDAERCAEDGYTCILCRPRDVMPPHLQPKKITAPPVVINEISKPSITQITNKVSADDPESGLVLGLDGNHYLDGICLSELGLKHIKSLQLEANKKKRKPKIPLEANAADKEAGILAAIESVVAGSSLDNSLEDVKFEPLNAKEEAEIYKDGMVWDRADASPPEGFTLCQTEQGVVVLRKRRQRNLQKLGIGGFSVRNRNVNKSTLNKDGIKEECDDNSEQLPTITESQIIVDKKKKPIRKKQKNKLIETYPSYLQEAFFGKSLLDTTKPKFESSSSDDEAKSSVSDDKTIKLSMEELKMIEAMRAKQQQQMQQQAQLTPPISGNDQKPVPIDMKPNNTIKQEIINEIIPPKKEKLETMVDEDSDTDALKDILPNDLLDTDLVNTIMNENDDMGKNAEDLVRLADDTDMIEDAGRSKNNEFNDLFSSHFTYEPIVMDSKDVEEIFKVVLTDESQESQESSIITNNPKKQQHQIIPPPGIVNQHQMVQQQHQQPQQHQQSQQHQQQLHQQQIMVQSNNQNIVIQQQRAIGQTGNPNMMQQMGAQNIVQQHLVQQQQHVGMDMMNQQSQVMQQQQIPQRPQPPMTPQNKIIPQFVESPYQKQITQSPQWPTSNMMGQGQLLTRMDSVESNISSISTPGTEDENVNTLAVAQPSYNQKTSERMKHDEVLGDMATISAVLYANINHPELKLDFPNWPDRFKQILKKWRALSNEQKAPYLQQSRDNRSQLKMKKANQDQEKITAQQKSLREQEQERQWKQLQVMRAREQQMQQMVLQEQRTQDPTMQLQISTNNNNYSIGPLASPSPNSRGTPFVAPSNKGRIGGTAQSPTTFHHPGKQMRPVQITRTGNIQQNMTPNPFSPQSQTPLSPLDQQFPGSPVTQNQIDPFSRPSSENSQPDSYIQHSPQSARSFGQQSPNPAQNRSPAYVSQASQVINNTSNPVRLNMDSGGYAQPPGTPRPQFNTGTNRPTVYARPGELFDNNQTSPFTSPRNDMFQAQQQQQQQMQVQSDRNRQLRDLLQRQQTPSSPICANQQQMMNQNSSPTPPPRWNGGSEVDDSQNTIPNSPNQVQTDITFRQPLPPSMILRPQRMTLTNPGGKIIRTNQLMQPVGPNQIGNPRGVAIGADVRQRIIRPGSVMIPGKQIITQQSPGGGPPQQFIISNGQRVPINININRTITSEFNQTNQQQQQIIQQNVQSGGPNVTFINQRGEDVQVVETKEQTIQQATTIIDNSIRSQAQSNQSNNSGPGETVESNEIPDNVTAELEKLEQEEGNGIGEVEGVGDILGGLDEDDDDLLVSLTAEMGAHFNILEYADPELDTLNDGEKANLLDSLELDDGESDKDDKKKDLEDKNDGGNQQKSNAGDLNKHSMQIGGGDNQHSHHAVSQAMQQQSNAVITTQQVVIGRTQHQGMHQSIIHTSGGKLSSLQQQQGSQLILSSGNSQEPNQFQHINRIKTIQMISTQQHMQPGMQQQQLQQHMQQQMQQQQGPQNAPIGKALPIRTQLLSKDGTIGIVSAHNAGSFQGLINRGGNIQTLAGVPGQRFQQVRITNPQGLQQQAIIHQGSRMLLQQQQQLNPGQQATPQQGHRMVGIVNTGNQQQTGNQSQPPPPPPPYPGPPPPYPGTVSTNTSQEQPLLLEDLLEQEKREQERQMISSTNQSQQQQLHPNEISGMQTPNPNMMGEQGFERLKVDVLNNQPHGVPAQGLLPLKQNQIIVNQINPNATMVGSIRHQFMPRGVNQQQWRGAVPNPQINTPNISGIQQQNPEPVTTAAPANNFQVYNANLLPPPQLPPENIVTEQDRQIQLVYEQWLNNQNTVLTNQLKYYETEVLKLRKVRKSLNSKQRQLKKNGNVLTEPDAAELSKITHEQTFYQKHLDSARKQARQHSLVMQDYKTKQQAKMQIVSPSQHSNSSPAQIAPPSPMAASPNPAQQHLMLHTSQSPITNSIMQPTQSPLQSPSPMMPSQSPGPQNPNVIMQSPGNPQSNSGMSPYNTMQQSPRIGTPHSQNDEGPFSPTGSIGPSVSPSIPGRLQSPSPRITSPQNRMPGPQAMQGGRIIQTSPIMIQGLQQQQQQNRFVRPQSLVGDPSVRPRLVQQQQQQGNIRGHPGYNSPLGSPQSNQQVSLEQMQNQRLLLVQRHRQQQLYQQQQQQQQQFVQQHQQLQQQHHQQQQQQMTQNSPGHQQPPSPMLQPQQNSSSSTSPMPPRSPMVHYNINQPPSSPMIGGSPLMRRPPSTGGPINSPANPDRPQSVESSPRGSFMQHSMNEDQMNSEHMNQGGGGGGHHGTIPFTYSEFYSRIKPGLRGGAPIWGRGAKRLPAPTMSSLIKESQQKEFDENEQMKREFHLAKVSILKKKTGPPGPPVSKNQNIPSTSAMSQKKIDLDDIVVIDSSPDEKQRIMDYDDDNDKALVATEVSLSSVAHHGSEVDDISVIESFQTPEFADIVSSPLESSEVENEYVLFASDVVVDYVDSDDSQKQVIKNTHATSDDDKNIHVINLNLSSPEGGNEANNSSDDDLKDKLMTDTTGYLNSPSGDHHYTSREEDILTMDSEIVIIDGPAKSPEEHNIATTEDFEAMIDCGNSKDGKDGLPSAGNTISNEKTELTSKASPPVITATFSNTQPPTVTLSTSTSQAQHIIQTHAMSHANSSSVIQQTSKSNEPKIIQIVTQNNSTNFGNVKGSNPIMTYATRIPLSAAMIQTRPGMSQVSLATHKKLVKDTQQTTAKVSIGNTTISVPVLKTVPPQNTSQGMGKMDSQLHKGISLNLSKSPTVINVGSQKSIFTLTTFNLTQPSSNARFVQAINRSSPPVNTSSANTSSIPTTSTSTMLYSKNSGQNQIILTTSDNIREKVSPKSSSTLSYSKLSSLTVTQDVSLPTKIFEDESISPDSSIEHDENDIIATEKMESLEKELQDKTNQVLKEESKKIENAAEKKEKEQLVLGTTQSGISPTTPPPSGNDKSVKSGVIPVHVIMKSRESSRSPSLPQNQQQRLMSIMPQLSPLSQPNEMITNMANVPQQLRSIMSSINSSNQGNSNISSAPSNSTPPNITTNEIQVNYESVLPTSKLENVSKGDEKPSSKEINPSSTTTPPSATIAVTTAQSEIVNTSPTVTTSPPANTTPAPQFVLHPTTNPSKIISAQLLTPTTVSPTSTNILVLKQLRTSSSPGLMSQTLTSGSQPSKHSFKSGAQSTIIALPQSTGGPNQSEHKFQFITTQLPNLTKIQPDIKEMKIPSTNIILSNALSSGTSSTSSSSSALPPPALIVTSRPGVISTNIPQSTTLTLVSSAQAMTTISGSILGATLSQPSTKTNANTLLHNQLTNSPFRRSKSTDEVPVFMKEPQPPQVISNKRHSLEASAVKPEPIDTADDNHVSSTSSGTPKPDQSSSNVANVSGCKFSNIQSTPSTKSEDSQNVLLKQLLQSSGSSTSNTPPPTSPAISTRPGTSLRAPSLGVVSSLEAQLARPVIPPVPPSPLSSISSSGSLTINQNSILNKIAEYSESTTNVSTVTTTPITTTHRIVSRETSFVSKPVVTPTESLGINRPQTPQQSITAKIEENARKNVSTPPVTSYQSVMVTSPQHSATSTPPISSTPSPVNVAKANLMPQMLHLQQQHSTSSPPPPYPGKTSSATPVIVKETSQQSTASQEQQQQQDTLTQQMNEIKKEIMDETSQQSMLSDQNGSSSNNKPDCVTPKEELNDSMEMDQQQMLIAQSSLISNTPPSSKNATLDPAIEMKRKKRREYQKQRRQMQIMNKELLNNTPKSKKSRKLSKIDEDYDTFIDNLMGQMRQLPSLQILEPLLSKNYNVCPIYGSGDFSKLNLGYNSDGENGSELNGKFGYAEQSNVSDFYNTKPFGFKVAQNDLIPQSTQRGFYDQEFPPIKLEVDDEKYRYDMLIKERDVGTPDTIISTSSPECGKWELVQNDSNNFPGLRLIRDENTVDEEAMINRSMSPQIPIIVPVPIRLKTGISLSPDQSFDNNKENERVCDIIGNSESKFGPPTPKDNNVTVTLTLTSSAAEDILGVLKDLASILNIPPPSTYQIVERTTTPPSQKLGLYRTKGRDGKEGVPIDIQTILNGAAKFCRHCDVVILNSMIRAKSSEFPLLALNNNNASGDIINESEDLYFCSKVCYKQFQWRPTSILDEEKQNKVLITSNLEFPPGMSIKSPVMHENTSCIEYDRQPNSSNTTTLKELLIKQEVREDAEHQIKRKFESELVDQPPSKLHKGSRYKYFTSDCFNSTAVSKYKKPMDKELTEMLFRMNITVTPGPKLPEDTRRCIFCHSIGDGVADGPSRLLNFDVDKWVHLNCALWSDGVYETENGALMQLESALQASLSQACIFCSNLGATLKCFKPRCGNIYHLSCAMKDSVVFYKNKSIMCASHAPKTEKDNELTTLSVERRVYVERDESRQVASVMHYSELSNLMRVGSLIFLNVGQLLPHQLQTFHNQNYIYPNGYKIIRFYWSMRRPNKRCRYICSIVDVSGRPEFRVLVKEPSEEDIELRDLSARAVWQRILEPLSKLRKDSSLVQIFPKYVSGEDLFGLSEPAIVRILESLPGVETLTDYKFKYGRNPLLELPLAINPSGAARTEAKLKATLGYHKKPHTQRTGSVSQRPAFVPTTSMVGEVACPYSKQFVHSKSSQYKKMKQEWRNNVFLARSKIQGLGLYAARDLEKHTMVIEYIGEVIRTELSELREKQYEARNRGIYMFRLDEERVVDATLSGGLARYINHSCNPNCVTEIVEVDREVRIIIFAKRRINRGEELSYDYKFDIEDDANKISCMCGAPNCRKWMN